MKTLMIVAIIVIMTLIGILIYNEIPTKRNTDATPRDELIAWSAFLYDSSDESDFGKTEAFMINVIDSGGVNNFLDKYPNPGEYAFLPKGFDKVDFEDFKNRLGTVTSFREFLIMTDKQLRKIYMNRENIPEMSFFPKTFRIIEDLVFSEDSTHGDIDRIYLPDDFERFSNLALFAEAFRDDAATLNWVNYNEHFRLARIGSTGNIVSFIATMPDIHESRLSRSDGERSVGELLVIIRDNFPKENIGNR